MSLCNQESMIAAALANGELPEELRLHLESCAVCGEVHSIARRMQQLVDGLAEEPRPSAASMWWRLNIRKRQDRARQAQAPLIWMGRILYTTIVLSGALLATFILGLSRPVSAIGLLALGAVALPVAITLWSWSLSKI
jgi:hypothetical protein